MILSALKLLSPIEWFLVQVENVPVRDQSCGMRHSMGVQGRVRNTGSVSGDTQLGEYPWHAAILKREEVDNLYVCGGSLIDSYHVLTAAHCIENNPVEELR